MGQIAHSTHHRNQIDKAIFGLSILALTLAGCAPEPSAVTVETVPPSPSATAKSTKSTISPTPTPTTALTGEPTGFNCESLLTLDELYEFNSNYYLSDATTPSLSSELANIVNSQSGVLCIYKSFSDGPDIQVALAKFPPSQNDMLIGQISQYGKSTSAYGNGTTAFFVTESGFGTINVVKGNYWLSFSSGPFDSPEDALKIATPILEKL